MTTPIRILVLAGFACLGTGCVVPPQVTPTPLQLQAIQAREFEAGKTTAFNAVLSVFQDLGYIVASADKETGFITASSPSGSTTGIWGVLGGSQSTSQTRATAFIEEIRPGFTTVRLNFVETTRQSSTNGQTSDFDQPIFDSKVYEAAFARIGDAVFVRVGNR